MVKAVKTNKATVATVATQAQAVTLTQGEAETIIANILGAAPFIGLKYVCENGEVFENVVLLAEKLAAINATQAQIVTAACNYYGINATSWQNKHTDKGGKGCLTVAKGLATTSATTADLHKALILQAKAAPKGGKYAASLAAFNATAETPLTSTADAVHAICAVAWAWGYLANKQANGKKGNLAAALASLA